MKNNITPIERHKKNTNLIIIISTILTVIFVSIITYLINF